MAHNYDMSDLLPDDSHYAPHEGALRASSCYDRLFVTFTSRRYDVEDMLIDIKTIETIEPAYPVIVRKVHFTGVTLDGQHVSGIATYSASHDYADVAVVSQETEVK